MTMAVSTELTILIVIFYLVLILGLGYYGYRKTTKVEDYMVAGRNTHPMVIALSYGATFISTSAIVGFGGTAAQYGMSLMWLTVLCIVVGVIIAFLFMGKRIRRIGKKLGALTYPELLGKMFGSKFLIYASGLIFVAAMPLYTAAVLIGGARFIETTLGVPYMTALLGFAGIVALYVVIGGLIAVMYTDAVQGAIMLAGMGILLVLTYVYLGGVTAANSALEAMTPLVPENLAAAGGNADSVIPLYINSAMPELFVIIFMLTLLSAAMSTLSSLLHTMGTTLGGDMFAQLKGKRYSVRANQIGIVVMMLASLAIAVVMPESIIARATAMFMGLCTAALLPAFTHGIVAKRPSLLAAKWSMIAGAGGWLLWTMFAHTAESQALGICNALFGVNSLVASPWNYLDPLVVGTVLSVIVLLVLIPLDKNRITPEQQRSFV